MDFNIQIGICGNQNKEVQLKDTAKSFGSGIAEVYATPAMVALMENTAFASIESLLPNGFSTVGISINVNHMKASLPGTIISCRSEVVNIDGKKVAFKISVSDNDGQIGTAEHTRFIINSDEFMSKLNKKE